jgi:hypothetical protein
VIADDQTSASIRALIDETFSSLSTPGSDFVDLFGSSDIAVSGSGQGELWIGPEQAVQVGAVVAARGFRWTVGEVVVWRRGEVAWARILGSVLVNGDDAAEDVPYWTTGVFGLEDDRWRWLYWGGSEPQKSPKV